jgi:membrane fusion protein (multidrug efflux system)
VQHVQQGGEVSFVVAAYPDQRFSGTIRFVSGVVRPTTRDLVVEAVVPNDKRLLMPGMFADVELTVGQRRLPTVPKSAVFMRDDAAHAYAVVADRVEERVLALGPELGDRVAVVRGAGEKDRFVVAGLDQLRNGQRVR